MRFYYRLNWLVVNIISKFFLGLTKSGLENCPESGGMVIASNHVSLVDPPLIGGILSKEIHYYAKAELFGKWYSPIFIKFHNTIPVKRGKFDRHAFLVGLDVLKKGGTLLVFPEGTRSKDGRLREGKTGAAKLSIEADVPVIPACVVNSNRIKDVLFSRERVEVRFGNPIYPSEYKHVEPDKEKLKIFTTDIMEQIKRLIENKD